MLICCVNIIQKVKLKLLIGSSKRLDKISYQGKELTKNIRVSSIFTKSIIGITLKLPFAINCNKIQLNRFEVPAEEWSHRKYVLVSQQSSPNGF